MQKIISILVNLEAVSYTHLDVYKRQGQQFGTAAGYALRVAYPLAGRAVPAPLSGAASERIEMAIAALGGLDPAEFAGAAERVIGHRAGNADLRQSWADFLFLYGLPNFFFHLTMGYASLRSAGVPLGKADFDAMHSLSLIHI